MLPHWARNVWRDMVLLGGPAWVSPAIARHGMVWVTESVNKHRRPKSPPKKNQQEEQKSAKK